MRRARLSIRPSSPRAGGRAQLDFAWGAAHFPTAPVKLIASDVDGTLLDSRHALRRSTAEAAAQLRAAGVELVLATGKARGPWVDDVVPELELEGKPGVFLQVRSGFRAVDDPAQAHRACRRRQRAHAL